jgi:hypothetical protein
MYHKIRINKLTTAFGAIAETPRSSKTFGLPYKSFVDLQKVCIQWVYQKPDRAQKANPDPTSFVYGK